jgi:hypothetical protein
MSHIGAVIGKDFAQNADFMCRRDTSNLHGKKDMTAFASDLPMG